MHLYIYVQLSFKKCVQTNTALLTFKMPPVSCSIDTPYVRDERWNAAKLEQDSSHFYWLRSAIVEAFKTRTTLSTVPVHVHHRSSSAILQSPPGYWPAVGRSNRTLIGLIDIAPHYYRQLAMDILKDKKDNKDWTGGGGFRKFVFSKRKMVKSGLEGNYRVISDVYNEF